MRYLPLFLICAFANPVAASDYPTTETVKMVVRCMQDKGGQTEENLYSCACQHDFIAAEMSFEAYENASLFDRYQKMPGKRGNLFRDSDTGHELVRKLERVREQADARCPSVKHIEPPRHVGSD